ncbi:hypothetical protein CSC76_17460 [Pseudoxanthomonas mexicana]|uniref:DUF4339 domain-containing protein n=1 Tax=Pseudoxanthomonas mexicana TaxID=128785 RepID=UPI00138A6255|nr:DUF4339 domain-containing protein [Pseudoxanthomonas mexicana]KAF1719984.1 hypothetical protein CSC76_17460 [Pseudoxanthomonas mexicana]
MSGWYYADRNREQHGPATADELVTHYRFGRIALGDLVWREGLPQWRPLRDFADELGLDPAPVDAAPAPPPVPTVAAPLAQTSLPPTPAAKKPGMSGGKIALIVAAVMVVRASASPASWPPSPSRPTATTRCAPRSCRPMPRSRR